MLRALAISAIVGYAAAFAPGATMMKPATRAAACSPQMALGQNADANAPPADLFNIWREDYMVSANEAQAQAAERAANTIFDGVLPPFSNVGNTVRGNTPDTPQLRGIGAVADFSTANPTSAYQTDAFGTVYLPNKDVMANPITGQGPEKAQKFVERMAQKTGQGGAAGGRAATGTQRAPSAGTQKRGGFFNFGKK